MDRFRNRQSALKDNMLLLVAICLTFYFLYHGVFGQRGLLALDRVSVELDQAELVLKQKELEVNNQRSLVSLLRPDGFDRDFAEELAVRKLGYAQAQDIEILQVSTNVAQQ